MNRAIAFLHSPGIPGWAARDLPRIVVVAFCALAMALAGHLPAL